jgi:hypothetical protein
VLVSVSARPLSFNMALLHPSHELGLGRVVHDLPSVCSLSTESDYVKNGSCKLLMQAASGFSVGWSKKAQVMSCGQLLA